jgi:hypothetical protein
MLLMTALCVGRECLVLLHNHMVDNVDSLTQPTYARSERAVLKPWYKKLMSFVSFTVLVAAVACNL